MSEITDAFEKCYGKIGKYYDEETWLERLGVFSAGWQSAMLVSFENWMRDQAANINSTMVVGLAERGRR